MPGPRTTIRASWTSTVVAALTVALVVLGCSSPAPAAKPASAPPAAAPSAGTAASSVTTAPPAATSPPVAAAPSPPPRATVRIGYAPLYSIAPTFLAIEKGYFERQGIDADMQQIASGPEGFAATAGGHLEITTTSAAAAVLNALAGGVDIRMISSEQTYPPDAAGAMLVVRKELKDSGQVNGPADLRGRKMTVAATGTAQEWTLDLALRQGGLTVADIEMVTMPFGDALAALGNGAVDGSLALEPLATESLQRGYAASLGNDFAKGAQITVLIANGTWLKQQPDAATRFMVAYLQACRDLYGEGWRRPDNVAIIEKWTKLPAATLMQVLPIICEPNGVIDLDSLNQQQEWYLARGYLRYTTPLDLRALLEDGPRQTAVQRLGAFQRN